MHPTREFEDFFEGLIASLPGMQNRSIAQIRRSCAEYFETLHEIPAADYGRLKLQLKRLEQYFPSSKQIWSVWREYCRVEDTPKDPEKAETQAKRGERAWIDRQWEVFQALPEKKKAFIKKLLPAGGMTEMVSKIMHIGIMRALDEGQRSQSEEWRKLG